MNTREIPKFNNILRLVLLLIAMWVLTTACRENDTEDQSQNQNVFFVDNEEFSYTIQSFCAEQGIQVSDILEYLNEAEENNTEEISPDPSTMYVVYETELQDSITIGSESIMQNPLPGFTITSHYNSMLAPSFLAGQLNIRPAAVTPWMTSNNVIPTNQQIAGFLEGIGSADLHSPENWQIRLSTVPNTNQPYFNEVIDSITRYGIGDSNPRFKIISVGTNLSQNRRWSILRSVFEIQDVNTNTTFFLKVQQTPRAIQEFQTLTLLSGNGLPESQIAQGVLLQSNNNTELSITLTQAVENSTVMVDLYDFILNKQITTLDTNIQAILRQNIQNIYQASIRSFARTGEMPLDLLDRSGRNILVNPATGEVAVIEGMALRVPGRIYVNDANEVVIEGAVGNLITRMRTTLRLLDIPEPQITAESISHVSLLPGTSTNVTVFDELGMPVGITSVTNSSETEVVVPKWFSEKTVTRFNRAMGILGIAILATDTTIRFSEGTLASDLYVTLPTTGTGISTRALPIDPAFPGIPDTRTFETYAISLNDVAYAAVQRQSFVDAMETTGFAPASPHQMFEFSSGVGSKFRLPNVQLCGAETDLFPSTIVFPQTTQTVNEDGTPGISYVITEKNLEAFAPINDIAQLDLMDSVIHKLAQSGAPILTLLDERVQSGEIIGYTFDEKGHIIYFTVVNMPGRLSVEPHLIARYIYQSYVGTDNKLQLWLYQHLIPVSPENTSQS